jgi:hypothetical protein
MSVGQMSAGNGVVFKRTVPEYKVYSVNLFVHNLVYCERVRKET